MDRKDEEMHIPKAISENTAITLQAGLLVTIICAAFYLGGQFTQFKDKLDYVSVEVTELRAMSSNDRWSYKMMKAFVTVMQQQNPDIGIPNIAEIRERYILSLDE